MKEYYSSGKLLISGEYLVLKGAEALAVPTKLGQKLHVELTKSTDSNLKWSAFLPTKQLWFSCELSLQDLTILNNSDQQMAEKLLGVIKAARSLNPNFLMEGSYEVSSYLEFDKDWGLGSSSTLLANIAKWAEIDAFALSDLTFGGSGYDVAIGMLGSEMLYTNPPAWDSFVWKPSFRNKLFFVYLNRKQNSREAIRGFEQKSVEQKDIDRVSAISRELAQCADLDSFQLLITEHENIIANILGVESIKKSMFSDYPFALKSLGAWGGDFILACGEETDMNYFRNKAYNSIFSFDELIK